MLIASNVGLVDNNILSDLTYHEEKDSQAHMTLSYLPKNNQIDFLELKNSKINFETY